MLAFFSSCSGSRAAGPSGKHLSVDWEQYVTRGPEDLRMPGAPPCKPLVVERDQLHRLKCVELLDFLLGAEIEDLHQHLVSQDGVRVEPITGHLECYLVAVSRWTFNDGEHRVEGDLLVHERRLEPEV